MSETIKINLTEEVQAILEYSGVPTEVYDRIAGVIETSEEVHAAEATKWRAIAVALANFKIGASKVSKKRWTIRNDKGWSECQAETLEAALEAWYAQHTGKERE